MVLLLLSKQFLLLGGVVSGSLSFSNSIFFCIKNFITGANNSMVSDLYIFVGKGTTPENDTKGLGLGSAVITLLCSTVPRDGLSLVVINFSQLQMCTTLPKEKHVLDRYCYEKEK
jgi:hypothetical protein